MSAALRAGYKQTEVGVIPQDWDVKTLGSCLIDRPSYGINAAAVPYSDKLPAYVRITDIGEDGRLLPGQRVSVRSEMSGNFYLFDGDIVLARTGASVGKSYRYNPDDGPLVYAGFLIRIRPNCERLLSIFAAAYVTTANYWRWVRLMSMRSGQPGINGNEFAQLPVALPALPEQRAIAAALSDVDALLAGMDRLIAKKRDLKQAAMQQLLTGQTRLPGFRGEWEVKRLGDVAHIKTGSRNNENKIPDGQYPFFVRSEQVERINTYTHDCEAILVPGEGRIGSIFHYITGRFDVHQRVYAITQFHPEVSGRFVHLCMTHTFGAWAMQNTVKATVDSLRLPTFQTFEFSLPPALAEQTAIATVLSDMDAELAALEARRDKTRAVKQAMMQELLTGKTRLV
jgi:type I restriction enzyme S subunit